MFVIQCLQNNKQKPSKVYVFYGISQLFLCVFKIDTMFNT